MSKTTSHGVLLLSAGPTDAPDAGALLLCHATGTPRWDIPKGLAERGETGLDAALREAQEECGLLLPHDTLLPLGRFAYLPHKELDLYAARLPRLDTSVLRCTSYFEDRRGHRLPEMDGFRWAPFADIPTLCGKSLAAVLARLDLPGLLARL